MINLKENITGFFAVNGMENLSITGNEAMAKMKLELDNLYDYASDKFYTLDTFILEMSPTLLDEIKDVLIIDEAMYFKNSIDDEEPLHETAGLNPIFKDCKIVQLSSGLSLQQEGYNFIDLYNFINSITENNTITLSIPLLSDDYYWIKFNKGHVTTAKNNLHRIRPDDLRLLVYQVMVLAGDKPIKDILEVLNF